MSCVVQKFGGTSVADIDCIKMAAKRVVAAYNSGNQMVVVVSAMAGVTNNLIELTEQVNGIFDVREYDVILSSGEQTNAGLMALAIQDLGIQARSWLGWQLPIKTDSKYGRARITEIDISEIKKRMDPNPPFSRRLRKTAWPIFLLNFSATFTTPILKLSMVFKWGGCVFIFRKIPACIFS